MKIDLYCDEDFTEVVDDVIPQLQTYHRRRLICIKDILELS